MRFFRFGPEGSEKPGAVDQQGVHRDVSSVIDDISPTTIADGLLGRFLDLDLESLPEIPASSRFGPCISTTGNFIAIGLNYMRHAVETDSPIPSEPIMFNKAPSCIVGPNDNVVIPRSSVKTDWEVELAFVMGREASYIGEDEALPAIFGYCICNDVSERDFQLERNGQWVKGKGCPTFGPIGPYLVTADEIPDPQTLGLWLDLNGERVQDSSTSDMIYPIKHIVSYLSQFVKLMPGDLITTGTPEGVGLGMKPPRFLQKGDTMKLGIDGLGVQQQIVV